MANLSVEPQTGIEPASNSLKGCCKAIFATAAYWTPATHAGWRVPCRNVSWRPAGRMVKRGRHVVQACRWWIEKGPTLHDPYQIAPERSARSAKG